MDGGLAYILTLLVGCKAELCSHAISSPGTVTDEAGIAGIFNIPPLLSSTIHGGNNYMYHWNLLPFGAWRTLTYCNQGNWLFTLPPLRVSPPSTH